MNASGEIAIALAAITPICLPCPGRLRTTTRRCTSFSRSSRCRSNQGWRNAKSLVASVVCSPASSSPRRLTKQMLRIRTWRDKTMPTASVYMHG